jgi:Regulator of Chromosome Condensation (RCC1) repeat protein/regulator of chromosome condensation (RCC1) repeat-containing protein
VVIDPRSRVLVVGDSFRVSWDLLDAEGDRVFNDEQPDWTSTNPAVGVVHDEPFNFSLEAVGTGTTTLRATVNGVTGSEAMTVIAPPTLASVSTGDGFPCAVTGDDVGLCWELATPTGHGAAEVLWPRGPELAPAFTTIEAGVGFRCGLTVAGVAECWGGRGLALGRGSADTSSIPAPVAGGLTFTSISASASHACALTAGGAAYCWGLNSAGQLGAASTDQCDGESCSLEPIAVSGGLTFESISAGAWHTCAVTAGGKAYCWGRNAEGELGDGTIENSSEPTPVDGDLFFASISAGGLSDTPSGHTCGVTTTKVAYCWGPMPGDGTSFAHMEPTPVAGQFQWRDVRAGAAWSCGIVTTGDMYCWGDHRRGQLGTGNTSASLVPALVAGGHTWTAVDAGSASQNCGLTTDGVIYCWGQLLETRTFTPVELMGQP